MKDEKIFDNEVLSDEELENVVGGSNGEIADDSRFLNVLLAGTKYRQCDRYCGFRINFDSDARTDVMLAWSSLGIIYGYGGDNVSYQFQGGVIVDGQVMGGMNLTREQAWAYAEKLVGKHLTEKQWNW